MNAKQGYKDLKVWQKAIELVVAIYKLTENFPKEETYGLISQLRRASVSIPSNIAEGYRRRNPGYLIQFFSTANGSAAELETQIFISKQLKKTSLLDYSKVDSLLEEVLKMLNVMITNSERRKR